MRDEELIKIYDRSYNDLFDKLFKSFDKIYVKAIDKKYATKFQLGIINLIGGFIIGSELDKKIIELYNHSIKLGANIAEIVNAIPETVRFYEQELKKDDAKNEVLIVWKRVFGIPYKIEKINAAIKGTVGSSFEHLTDKKEIAEQLGKQRAVVDLQEQIKAKFIEHGGSNELAENDKGNLLPVEYNTIFNLKESLAKNDLGVFFKILQSVFASLSYDMKITEGYFHSHIHLILNLLDFEIQSEVETNQGRIDSVIVSEKYIHIIEFKQDDCDIALEQILKKKYYQKYLLKNKPIILVGVAIDKKQRNIVNWKMKSHE